MDFYSTNVSLVVILFSSSPLLFVIKSGKSCFNNLSYCRHDHRILNVVKITCVTRPSCGKKKNLTNLTVMLCQMF